jgi:hypothetical protein
MAVVENENYLQNELSSLGTECKRKNELNDTEKLGELVRQHMMITTQKLTNHNLTISFRERECGIVYGFAARIHK